MLSRNGLFNNKNEVAENLFEKIYRWTTVVPAGFA
jgi:hypothetical protein